VLFPISGLSLLSAQAPLEQQSGKLGISKLLPNTGEQYMLLIRASDLVIMRAVAKYLVLTKPELVTVKGSMSWEKVGVLSRENSQGPGRIVKD